MPSNNPAAKYMINKRRTIYTMLENVEIDWNWDDKEVVEFDKSFKEGLNALELADKFNRPPEEIALMILDRAMQGYIEGTAV